MARYKYCLVAGAALCLLALFTLKPSFAGKVPEAENIQGVVQEDGSVTLQEALPARPAWAGELEAALAERLNGLEYVTAPEEGTALPGAMVSAGYAPGTADLEVSVTLRGEDLTEHREELETLSRQVIEAEYDGAYTLFMTDAFGNNLIEA